MDLEERRSQEHSGPLGSVGSEHLSRQFPLGKEQDQCYSSGTRPL
jgi:hypothetical protein